METITSPSARARAICDLGHDVEVFSADGIVTATVHRDYEMIVDTAGATRQRKCPACEATAKRLIRSRWA